MSAWRLPPFAWAALIAACGGEPKAPPSASHHRAASPPDAPGPHAPPADAGGEATAPQPAPADRGPMRVILITIDSLRADMPWAGYPREIAPRLTALSRRAIVYPHAYSISSFTSKSVGGLLSGRYPSELIRTGEFFTRYAPANEMFCERLAAQGVPCLGAHAHAYFMKGIANFDQGFATWRLVPGIHFDAQWDPFVTSQKLTPLAIELLKEPSFAQGPAFAWFHFMDPHDMYKSHPESPNFGRKSPRDLYDEEVFYTDLWVGKLLDWIEEQPWAARTAIIVSADHGEAFGEHGLVRHANSLYEMLVHVPLFFVLPGRAPRTIEAYRSHLDLAPTILDLVGARPAPDLPGRSLVPELLGGPAEARDVVCDLPKDEINARHRALIHEGWKLIAFGEDQRFELYDLAADPGEKTDLYAKEPDRAKAMVARYREASRGIRDIPPR